MAWVAATRTGPDPRWKCLVVRLPANTVEIEFSNGGPGAMLKNNAITPLDSLGHDGWDLVTVAREGTTKVCFFKAPADVK